ncbi:hypothetical protein LP416_23690 [Polaromonas sp. P2-4]|nr:hypothetical protein LP416_23690 [Polaromonas sp. P2-4]
MLEITDVAELPLVDTHAHIYTTAMPLAKDAWRMVEKPAPGRGLPVDAGRAPHSVWSDCCRQHVR